MKKFLFMLTFCIVALCSCNRYKVVDSDYTPTIDTAAILSIVHDDMCVSFSNVEQVIDWKQDYFIKQEIDSTVMALDRATLTNICQVLKYKNKRFDLDDIVTEYNLRKDVYTALSVPKPNAVEDTTKATPPAEQKESVEHFPTNGDAVIDTIIDGNRALIFKTVKR